MDYIIAAVVIFAILIAVVIAAALAFTAVLLLLAVIGGGWLAWRLLPFRARRHVSRSPVQRLTDHYVAGHIDLGEFERRVARLLRSTAHQP